MQKFLFFLLFIAISIVCNAQNINKITFNNSEKSSEIYSSNSTTFKIRFPEIYVIQKNCNSEVYNQIYAPELKNVYGNGKPALPSYEKIIEIPLNAVCDYKILNFDIQTIDLNKFGENIKIIPTVKPVSKKYSLNSVNYVVDSLAYSKDNFSNNLTVKLEYLGTMRDKNLLKISVLPFDYNPKKNILKIYNSIDLEINFNVKNNANSKVSHGQIVDNEKVAMAIVAHPTFKQQAEDFAAWKTMQGFYVKTIFVNQDISNNKNTIKNYLKNLYENPSDDFPRLSYVVILGDVNNVPAFDGTATYGNEELEYKHVTDLYYCEYTGDYLPEVMYGRISATNVDEMQNAIEKIINYEKCNFSDVSFLRRQMFISGTDNDYSPTYGNGQIEYIISNYANSYHNIDTLVYPYYISNVYRRGNSHNFGYGIMSSYSSSAEKSILTNINKGVGLVNYTGHGEEYFWEDPYISTTEINNLEINNLYGFWIANCCLTASFQKSESLSESVLRKQGRGAAGYIGAGNLTYWDDDFYWAVGALIQPGVSPDYQITTRGVFDGLYHYNSNEQNIDNQYITAGEILNCGNLAVMESNSPGIGYYWEIYNLSGDPSMMPYTVEPEEINVKFSPEKLSVGNSFVTIETEPFAMVGFSQNGKLIASGFADKNGNLNLNFDAQNLSAGTANLVVSAQNKIPYIKTIDIQRPNEIFVTLADFVFQENPTVGKNNILTLTVKNIAEIFSEEFNAKNVKLYLSTDSENIIIENPEFEIGDLLVDEEKNQDFSVKFSENYPFNQSAKFNLEITADNFSQNFVFTTKVLSFDIIQNFSLLNDSLSINYENGIKIISNPITKINSETLYEYKVETQSFVAVDGVLQSGEVAQLKFKIINSGNLDIDNFSVVLSSPETSLNIENQDVKLNKISKNDTAEIVFNVNLSKDFSGNNLTVYLTSDYNGFSKTSEFNLKVNTVTENFENLGKIPSSIINSENYPWTIDSVDSHSGKYCLKSGKIKANCSTKFEINTTFIDNDTISFYVKTSCEDGYVFSYYDCLTFSVDGETKGVWYGKSDWKFVKYAIEKGNHNLTFTYSKDDFDSMYDDCAWIDDIVFPAGSYIVRNGISLNAAGLPKWLTFANNNDGTGILTGTSPKNGNISFIKITANQNDKADIQDFVLYYGNLTAENSVKINPNPAKDFVNVYIDKSFNFNELVVFNQRGQKVLEKNNIPNYFKIYVNNLGKGMFIFKFSGSSGTVKKKIIIL